MSFHGLSDARKSRRQHLVTAARAMVGFTSNSNFDPIHSDLCPIDVAMVAGSPWLQDAMQRDFQKSPEGYLKIGGGANTPGRNYFFRSSLNLAHYMKRQNFYLPRGGHPLPVPGMIAFFDVGDRGRYNFIPDRSGIIIEAQRTRATRVVVSQGNSKDGYDVKLITISRGSDYDRDFIGYGDLP